MYTSDDFRLRLDGPLRKRDARATGTTPVVQPLSWEPVTPPEPNMLGSVPDATEQVEDPAAILLPVIVEAERPREVTPALGLLARLVPEAPARTSGPVAQVEPEPPKLVPVIVEAEVPREVTPALGLLVQVVPDSPVRTSEPVDRVEPPAPPERPRRLPRLAEAPIYAPQPIALTRPTSVSTAPTRVVAPPSRKKNSGRRFMSLLLVLATVAGGAFAVKHFVLDVQKWDPGIESMANEVSDVRGLSFETPVHVVTLPMRQYAAQFTDTVLGLGVIDRGLLAAEWRAVGLLNGPLDSETVGMVAAMDSPAFYDPDTTTVYEIAGLPDELNRFAVERALAVALLDQQLGWSDRMADATPTEALAIRAVVDADAIAVAREALASPEAADVVARQLASLRTESVTAPTPSVWASSMLGRPGLPLQPTFGSLSARQRTAQFDLLSANDAVAYDAARPPSVPMTAALLPTARGMMYWYHALAGRIGSTAAWAAASAWNGDATVVTPSATAVCVESTITALDPFSAQAMLGAFQQWAAAALPESTTEVTADTETTFKLKACDPGAAVPTADMSAVVPFGGAAVEGTIVAIGRAGTTNLPERAQVCLVRWARTLGGALAYPGDSPELVESSTGWNSPYVASHTPSAADIDACRV